MEDIFNNYILNYIMFYDLKHLKIYFGHILLLLQDIPDPLPPLPTQL